ncbi:hypothetical protein YC2023_064322 [Brassica napus]
MNPTLEAMSHPALLCLRDRAYPSKEEQLHKWAAHYSKGARITNLENKTEL